MKKNKYITFAVTAALFSLSGVAFSGNGNGNGKGNGLNLPSPDYDFRTPSAEKVELGRNLMFDKILSGNKNISCGTCHHSLTDTGDGLSLPVGEGGVGLGVNRTVGAGSELVIE